MTRAQRFAVHTEHDPLSARLGAERLAAAAGMDPRTCAEIAVLVSELGSNIVKFAGNGTITLRVLEEGRRIGIEVIAEDEGPGFDDPTAAVEDGYSEGRAREPNDSPFGRRGLGAGLGAVKRLSDELRIENLPHRGARCVVRKWVLRAAAR